MCFLFLDPINYDHDRDYEVEHKRVRRDLPSFPGGGGGGGRASPPPPIAAYGDSRRIPLEKLAELERRVGLGGDSVTNTSGSGTGSQGSWGRKEPGWS